MYTRVHLTETQATLSLGQVTRESAGHYTCLADNGYNDKIVEKTVQIKVECKYDLEAFLKLDYLF